MDMRTTHRTFAAVVSLLVMGGWFLVVLVSAAEPVGSVPVTSGETAIFRGSGFMADEDISLWMTSPDGIVIPLVSDTVDSYGMFAVSLFFPSDGQWQVTAQGRVSRHAVIGSFRAGTTDMATTTAPTDVATQQVATGQRVDFTADGFASNELLALWTTAPDGTVHPLAGATADVTGAIRVTVAFPVNGFWYVTAHSTSTGKEMIGGFTVGEGGSTNP